MVKHIVMWQLKDRAHNNAKEENALIIKDKLEALGGKIEGLLSIEVGIDFLGEGNFDIVLYTELRDEDALDFYQKHPLHQAIIPFVKEATKARQAVDYKL